MKKVFIIVYENELEFDSGSDIVGDHFVNSDNTVEYCGSWGKIQFNKNECLKSISSTVNYFIQSPEKEQIYFGCDKEDVLEIQSLILSENCEVAIISYADFMC